MNLWFKSISNTLFILSPHYLYFSNSLFIWKTILSNTTLYFIFIFIKIIFLLFYFNFFFSLLISCLPPQSNKIDTNHHLRLPPVNHPRHWSVSHWDRRANPQQANPKHPRPTPRPRSTKQRSAMGTTVMAGLHLERTEKRGRAKEKKKVKIK